jgi:putative glutamine amidotransferase
MAAAPYAPRIGIFGNDETTAHTPRGCNLWPLGYAAALTAAGATPLMLRMPPDPLGWDEILSALDGVLLLGGFRPTALQAACEERLCLECQERGIPFLGVDHGLHVLNRTYGGTSFGDVSREMPQAVQHLHPPEPGDRHAITVTDKSRLAELYGEGEIVVNSEHRQALNKVARGFIASAHALDGVIEGIEAVMDGWFAVGVQWHPASASASGLDIQLFRGLADACREFRMQPAATVPLQAA